MSLHLQSSVRGHLVGYGHPTPFKGYKINPLDPEPSFLRFFEGQVFGKKMVLNFCPTIC